LEASRFKCQTTLEKMMNDAVEEVTIKQVEDVSAQKVELMREQYTSAL